MNQQIKEIPKTEMKPVSPVQPEVSKAQVIEPKPSITYPRQISKKVYIRRKKSMGAIPGQNPDDAILKIGSSFAAGTRSQLRGLTFEEEILLLPNVIGISADSPNWEAAVKGYWSNISADIPSGDGVELEVGLRYSNKDAYDYDVDRCTRDSNNTLINPKGTPINVHDYILWRYCLLYSRVANTLEDIGKSPKIEFYLYSKDKEVSDKKVLNDNKKKANQLLYSRMSERDWVAYVLRVLISMDKNGKRPISDVDRSSEDERDNLLVELVEENPGRFLNIANDKNLEIKSFIELCIATNKLQRIPNTDTIAQNGTVIGNTTDETVAFLNNPKNIEFLNTLKAQTRLNPS